MELMATASRDSTATVTATVTETRTVFARDGAFGPQYGSKFDFTLLFEHTVFTIVPTVLLILACPFYIYFKRKTIDQVERGKLFWTKIGATVVLFAIQIAQLVLWTQSVALSVEHDWAIAAGSLSCCAALCIGIMLDTEHRRTIRPSTLLSIYFGITVILDIAKARSYLLRHDLDSIGAVQIVVAATKFLLLILEEIPKTPTQDEKTKAGWLRKEYISGFWSHTFSLWLNETFMVGFRRRFNIRDIGETDPEFLTSSLVSRFKDIWSSKATTDKSHSLMYTTFQLCRGPLLLAIIPRLLFSICFFSQPLLIYHAVDIIHRQDVPMRDKHGLMLATLLDYGGIMIFRSMYMSTNNRSASIIRGALTGMITEKALRLPSQDVAEGSAITLITADLETIVGIVPVLHNVWINFIEIAFMTWFLSIYIGYSCFLMFIPASFSTISSIYLSPYMGNAQRIWNENIEFRVNQTTSILAQAKQVRLCGYDDTLGKYIQKLRLKEIKFSQRFRGLQSIVASVAVTCTHVAPVIMVAGALFVTKLPLPLESGRIFATLAIVAISAEPIYSILSVNTNIGALIACFGRIQEFLNAEERRDDRQFTCPERGSFPPGVTVDSAKPAFIHRPIDILDASLAPHGSAESTSENVDIFVTRGQLAIASGPTASGKSVFLKALLGEAGLLQGKVFVRRDGIAYCGQKAWLRNGSIRQNILGQRSLDLQWYHTVVRACALDVDFRSLEGHDSALTGNNGSRLSGGQRQRIALARAVYSRAPVIVMDDIFNSLDPDTAQTVLVNLLGDDGLLTRNEVTVVLVNQTVEFFEAADVLLYFDEQGAIEMRSGLGMRHVFSSSFQAPPETEPEEEELQMTNAEQVAQEVTEDGSAHHKGDLSVYLFFFETGPAWQFLLFLVAVTLHTICERVSAIFMRIWLDSFPDSRSMFATYAVLGFSPILTFFAMNILYFQFLVPNFAATMHQMLVDSILGATLPYLTSTDNGIIINRISQHMTLITQQFARDFFQLPYAGTSVIVDVIIIASTSLYAIVLAPIVCLVLYLVQLVYLRTSRQLRLLDLESKTPLYSYLAEVGSGIEHIRAFGWEEEYRRRAFALVDATQRPYYLLLCLGRWLNLVMDGNTAVLAVILMAFANYWDQVTSKNGVGLAFVTLISLGETTTFFMNQWVAIETSLGAITSIRSFVKNTPSEPRNQDTKKMPQSWPTRGAIEFKGVTAEYDFKDISSIVLRNVSISIPGGHKARVIGRTGSGKSSLYATLLDCLNYQGSITIDGTEICDIPRELLRTKVIGCPQDKLILPGTIRQNLMPWIMHDPAVGQIHEFGISHILLSLGILHKIDGAGGLDAPMKDLKLSDGEMQLFCIARTSLTKLHLNSRVILLDEVTSHLDAASRQRAISTMNVAFEECTVLNISHQQRAQNGDDIVFKVDHGAVTIVDGTEEDVAQNASSQGPGFPGMPNFQGFGAALDPEAPITDPPPSYSATTNNQDSQTSPLPSNISQSVEPGHSIGQDAEPDETVSEAYASSLGQESSNSVQDTRDSDGHDAMEATENENICTDQSTISRRGSPDESLIVASVSSDVIETGRSSGAQHEN